MTSQREHAAMATTGDLEVPISSGWNLPAGGPLVSGTIALTAAMLFAAMRWSGWARYNFGSFILVGRQFAVPSQLPRGIPVVSPSGYDGQFFYRLAMDPANFSRLAYGISMDHVYRYMRIGYPALTWLLSAGQHSLVPAMLVAVNVLAAGALGYLGGVFARFGGRSALWGLLLPAYFGLVMSVSRDTAEALSAVFLLAGLLSLRARRPVLAGLVLAYGALTRETVMVAAGAIAIVRVIGLVRARRAPGREDLAWVLPAVAFAAWQAVIFAVTGKLAVAADGGVNTGTPFVTPLEAVIYNIRHLNTGAFNQYDLRLFELSAFVFCAIAALAVTRHSRAPVHEKLALVLYGIEICIVTPTTWFTVGANMRSFIEVYLVAVIILLSMPAGRRGARFAWLLPVLGVLMILAVAILLHRKLTMALSCPPIAWEATGSWGLLSIALESLTWVLTCAGRIAGRAWRAGGGRACWRGSGWRCPRRSRRWCSGCG